MFAVIKTGGKQYKVSANDVIKVEKLQGEANQEINFSEVLMIGNEGDITVGFPLVEGAVVKATIIEQMRARKVIAFKKRRRQNSKRTRGHRQSLTLVRISEIVAGGSKAKKKTSNVEKQEG